MQSIETPVSHMVKHGIDEDESDYRLHVGFHAGKAYLFPTLAGRESISGDPPWEPFNVGQHGVRGTTGAGF